MIVRASKGEGESVSVTGGGLHGKIDRVGRLQLMGPEIRRGVRENRQPGYWDSMSCLAMDSPEACT